MSIEVRQPGMYVRFCEVLFIMYLTAPLDMGVVRQCISPVTSSRRKHHVILENLKHLFGLGLGLPCGNIFPRGMFCLSRFVSGECISLEGDFI